MFGRTAPLTTKTTLAFTADALALRNAISNNLREYLTKTFAAKAPEITSLLEPLEKSATNGTLTITHLTTAASAITASLARWSIEEKAAPLESVLKMLTYPGALTYQEYFAGFASMLINPEINATPLYLSLLTIDQLGILRLLKSEAIAHAKELPDTAAITRIDELQSALTAAQEKAAKLKGLNAAAKVAIIELQSTLLATQERIVELQGYDTAAKAKIVELQSDLAATQEKNARLQRHHAVKDDRIAELQFAFAAIQDQNTELQKRLVAENSRLSELQLTLAAAQLKNAKLQKQDTAANDKIAELQLALAAAQEKVAELQDHDTATNARIAELQLALAVAQDKTAVETKRSAVAEETSARTAELLARKTEELTAVGTTLSAQSATLQDLTTRTEATISALTAELTSKDRELQTATMSVLAKSAELETMLASLQAAQSTTTATNATISELEAKHRVEIDTLGVQLAAITEKNTHAQAGADGLRTAAAAMQKELTYLRTRDATAEDRRRKDTDLFYKMLATKDEEKTAALDKAYAEVAKLEALLRARNTAVPSTTSDALSGAGTVLRASNSATGDAPITTAEEPSSASTAALTFTGLGTFLTSKVFGASPST